jgi:hypothetical protein
MFGLSNAYGLFRLTAVAKLTGRGKARAEWQAMVAKAGEYELFAYVCPLSATPGDTASFRQYYSIEYADERHETTLDFFYRPFMQGNWMSLGFYSLPAGPCKVVLDDRGRTASQIIYADAVKWVPTGERGRHDAGCDGEGRSR